MSVIRFEDPESDEGVTIEFVHSDGIIEASFSYTVDDPLEFGDNCSFSVVLLDKEKLEQLRNMINKVLPIW